MSYLAGFAEGYNEKVEREEEARIEQEKMAKQFEYEGKLKQLTLFEEQKEKDAKLAKDVDAFFSMTGVDPSQRSYYAEAIEGLGLSTVVDMHTNGTLKFEGPAAGGAVGGNWETLPLVEIENAPIQAHNYLVQEKGIAPVMASGLVGNIMQESGQRINWAAVGDNGNAFGSVQWNGDRKRAYLAYAKERGVPPTDWKTQLDYMVYEGQTSEKSAWQAMSQATTPEDAALLGSKLFWRPGTPHNENRMRYAKSVHQKLSDLDAPYYAGKPMGTPAPADEAQTGLITPGKQTTLDRQTELTFGGSATARQSDGGIAAPFNTGRSGSTTATPVSRTGVPSAPAPTGEGDGWLAPQIDENTPAALRPRAGRTAAPSTGRPGLRIQPKGADLSALAGQDAGTIEQWIVAQNDRLSDGDHSRALEILNMTRRRESNPDAFRDPEAAVSLTDTELAAALELTRNDPPTNAMLTRIWETRQTLEADEERANILDMGALVGKPLSELVQHDALYGAAMPPETRAQLQAMIDATSAREGKALYWQDAGQLGRMTTDALRSAAATEESPEGRARIERALQARDVNSGWLSTELGKATNLDQATSLEASIMYRRGLSEVERTEALEAVRGLQLRFIERESIRKGQEGGTMLYLPRLPNGSVSYGAQVQAQRNPNGAGYVNAADGSPLDMEAGALIAPETAEQFEKLYNTPVLEISQSLADGANAVRDLVVVRDLVIKNPASVNQYLGVAADLIGQTEGMAAAFKSMVEGGTYSVGFENEMLKDLRGLTSADRLIAQGMLRAAYAVAKARGSSGQALSDNELDKNLAALGAGLTDARKIVPLLNAQVSDLVASVETSRSTRVASLLTLDDLKNSLSDTPVGTEFQYYAETQMGQHVQGYLEAMQGKSDYAYTQEPASTRTTTPAPAPVQRTQGNAAAPLTAESIKARLRAGETIMVTPEIVAADPNLKPYLGQPVTYPKQ